MRVQDSPVEPSAGDRQPLGVVAYVRATHVFPGVFVGTGDAGISHGVRFDARSASRCSEVVICSRGLLQLTMVRPISLDSGGRRKPRTVRQAWNTPQRLATEELAARLSSPRSSSLRFAWPVCRRELARRAASVQSRTARLSVRRRHKPRSWRSRGRRARGIPPAWPRLLSTLI
jgi:hypothetical protein